MSTLTIPTAQSIEVPLLTGSPVLGPWRRAVVRLASVVAIGAASGSLAFVPLQDAPTLPVGVAALVATGLGLLAALVQGSSASDRRGRRRFVLIGTVLLSLGMLSALGGWVALASFVGGVGSVLVVMAADGWMRDAKTPPVAVIGLASIGVAAGVGLAWWSGWPAALGLIVVAAILAAIAGETVSTPQTPVFVLPGSPPLRGRPAASTALLLLIAALPVLWLGLMGAWVALGVLIAIAAAGTAASRRRGPGDVLPSEPGTRSFRRAVDGYDKTAQLAPAAAGTVATVEGVRGALEYARTHGLGVAMHSTGHAAMGHPDLDEHVLLRVAMEGEVAVDPIRRLVRIPAGTAWKDVVTAVGRHGLAVPHGSSGHVGVVGYITRGGLSAYGRTTGVAANSLESVEIVTADGRLVIASREVEPDLFWAVRGGGGGFGVVTAVTVRAFEPGEVVTGTAAWELRDAPAVADAWAQWTAVAPSSVTTSLRILTVPPLPGMPFGLTRRPLLFIDGTAVDGDDLARVAANDLLARLRTAAPPALDTWRLATTAEVPNTHMDPPFGPAHSSAHALVGGKAGTDVDQARAIVSSFLSASVDGPAGVGIAELRQLGGRLAEPPVDAGAVGHYRGAFGWVAIALHGRAGQTAASDAIDRAWSPMSGWATGYTAPTLATERSRPARSFPADIAERVAAIRSEVDPDGLFRADVAPGSMV